MAYSLMQKHQMAATSIRLGVDIGGTFTDVVLEKDGVLYSTKVLTTYAAPENAIIDGMHQVCKKATVRPSQIDQIIHGTTLATNALIERRGAKTALITTEGFRDVIEMRTESRFEQYDLPTKNWCARFWPKNCPMSPSRSLPRSVHRCVNMNVSTPLLQTPISSH